MILEIIKEENTCCMKPMLFQDVLRTKVQGVPNRGQAQLDSCCRKKPSSNARHSSQLFYLPVHTVLLNSLRSKCIVLDQLSRGSPPLILWRVKTPFSHFVTCRYCRLWWVSHSTVFWIQPTWGSEFFLPSTSWCWEVWTLSRCVGSGCLGLDSTHLNPLIKGSRPTQPPTFYQTSYLRSPDLTQFVKRSFFSHFHS